MKRSVAAQADHEHLQVRGILRGRWAPTDFETRRFNPDQPRIPGGEHGGEWAHNPVGAVVDALKKVAGPDKHAIAFDDGRYLDWSTKTADINHLGDDKIRRLEIGDNDSSVQMDMSGDEQRSLFHALTLTVMADEGHPQSHHLAALAASGHESMRFSDGGMVDWSIKNPDGSRQIEASDDSDSVQFDLSPEEFRQWQAALGLSQLQDNNKG